MNTLHQIWLGVLPAHQKPWVDSMRRLAQALGMEHHLWTRDELERRYARHEMQQTLLALRGTVPDNTLAGLASDWYRLALLADLGGLYADTDFEARNIAGVAAYEQQADLEFSNEQNECVPCNGLIWCRGKRGQEAAKRLFALADHRLRRMLPAGASDLRSRAVAMCRQDECRSGIARNGIGPQALRAFFIPALRKAGFSVAALPRPVEADAHRIADAWLAHRSAGSWYNLSTDWPALARAALQADAAAAHERAVQSLPPWLRPQGTVARQDATPAEPASPAVHHEPLPPEVRGLLTVPKGTRRVVILSNVLRGFPAMDLQAGDWCIHLNTARHLKDALAVPGTAHALIVRHGLTTDTPRRVMWFMPEDFTGCSQAVFLPTGSPLERMEWWQRYRRETSCKSPTTGFIAANWMRALAPGLPLLLVGFAPGVARTWEQWSGHAWKYEAEWYKREGFDILPPR